MVKHIYHYNVHSEQRFFLGHERDLYNLIALNGNIVSHTPAGVAAFLSNTAQEFYIDPQTHAFQHPTIHLKRKKNDGEIGKPPKFEFKPSIDKLARDRLGGPFALVIEQDRPILPKDFYSGSNLDESIITEVCERVVKFQTETMSESLDDEAKEFMDQTADFQPSFVVAPYFYLSPRSFREWLEITIACYKKTKQIVQNLPVFLALVISKEALDDDVDGIISLISEIRIDGILIWIDDHIEENLSSSRIKKFIKLLKGLKKSTDTIYNSHGGYLSTLLCHSELNELLNGVGHSINYGESRAVIPIGGGIPFARFYYPSIHSRLRFGDALSIVLAKNLLSSETFYRENVCKCVQCIKLIKKASSVEEAFYIYGGSNPVTFRRRGGSIVSLEYPSAEAKQVASYHYLYNKAVEFRNIRTQNLRELLEDLEKTYKEIAPYSGDELVAHLLTWKSSLE